MFVQREKEAPSHEATGRLTHIEQPERERKLISRKSIFASSLISRREEGRKSQPCAIVVERIKFLMLAAL